MKNKRNPKERVRKILFSFWFWVIVAVISSFIAISIPIQFEEGSKLSFNKWEGTNFYATIFLYLTRVAWIIAFVILFVKIIKRIQKSKIGDYWKISFTILGIIGIIVFVFFSIKDLEIFEETEEKKSKIEIKEEVSKSFLEEKGYEFLSLGFGSYSTETAIQNGFTIDTNCYQYRGSLSGDLVNEICWSNYTYAYLEMKSLGNKNSQIWNGLIALASFKPISLYQITILTPTETCTYYITGKTYDKYLSVDLINNYSEENINLGRELAQKVNDEIEKYEACS